MKLLAGLINSDFAEVDESCGAKFVADRFKIGTGTIAELPSNVGREFESKKIYLPVEFSSAAIQQIVRQFSSMDAKESSASLKYMNEHLILSCDGILKPRIESFILRLLERIWDFAPTEKALIITYAIDFIETFQSSEIALKVIQTVRKILSNPQGSCNMNELTTIFNLILLSNSTYEGPSQNSICSQINSEFFFQITDCIVDIFLNGTHIQKQIIIDHIYNCILLENIQPSPFGCLLIDRLLKVKNYEATIELKLLALKHIYGYTDSEALLNILFKFPYETLKFILTLGDILNYFENSNIEVKNNQLISKSLKELFTMTESGATVKNIPSIFLQIDLSSDPLLVHKNDTYHPVTYLKFAARLLQFDEKKNLFFVKFLLKNSSIAKTSDVIQLLKISIRMKVNFIPFLEIILEVKQVIENETLDESVTTWLSDNVSEQTTAIFRLLQMHCIDIKQIVCLILEKNDNINQYLSPFIPHEFNRAFLEKLRSTDIESHSLRYIVRMLLCDGDPEKWEKLIESLGTKSRKNAIAILTLFNEEIEYGNAKAVSSGLSTIQRLVKNAIQCKYIDRISKKIVESTIQNLKIYSTKLSAINSFHMGNLKMKRTRVNESGWK